MKPHHAIFISSQRGRNVHTKEGGEEVKMNLIEVTDKVTGMITTVNVNNMNTVIKSGDNAMFVFGNYSLTTEESYEEIKSFLEQMC